MTPDLSKISVLIIDDSPHISILLARLLKKAGIESIDSAENGRLGLQKVTSEHPNLIFLDGVMPEMDGITTLREIKTISPQSVVVINTSLSTREIVLQFKEAGADFYLLKPYEEEKFHETLMRALSLVQERLTSA